MFSRPKSFYARMGVHALNALAVIAPNVLPVRWQWLAKILPYAASGLTEWAHYSFKQRVARNAAHVAGKKAQARQLKGIHHALSKRT